MCTYPLSSVDVGVRGPRGPCHTDSVWTWAADTFFRILPPLDRLGPVAQFHENSKYYSAVPPAPNKLVDENLPHVTIEMPVYKESLTETM